MTYLDFVSKTSWVNITPIISICPVDKIIKEIKKIESLFIEERDEKQYKKMKSKGATGVGEKPLGQKNWQAVTLYSASGDYTDIISHGIESNHNKESYFKSFRNIKNHSWTQLADYMPTTVKWLKEELGQYMMFGYIKIAKLDAGGKIPVHTDIPPNNFDFKNTKNTYNMLNTVLVELNYPSGVTAWHDNTTLPYQKGSIMFINTSKSHGVENLGNEARYNLRIQGLQNKKFRNKIINNINFLGKYPNYD